ncbi:MAG: polysaccharide pyruvyl transferase family protein [Rikenellaceae bacterium]
MKVGILTLPLHTNYGGVLQAYALWYSLHNMGHEPYLIDCRVDPRYANLIKRPAASILRFLSVCLPPLAPRLKPLETQMRADKVLIRSNIEPFIRRNIPLRHYLNYRSISKSDFDAIVVGSDQVWRPEYFRPISSAYLDFAKGWSIKRIAYAASFGVDIWEYSESQTRKCSDLLSRFDAVSLRESSGVEMCAKHLKHSAVEVLDPTLILSKDIYLKLIAGSSDEMPKQGGLMVSFLDSTPDKQAAVDAISTRYGVETFSVNSRVEDRNAPIKERIQPPVEQWLSGFASADYVITDSYHACIFAIIFNKPFVAYANPQRGYTRFLSLLSRLGLAGQLFESSSELNIDRCFEIDWGQVNEKLNDLKSESLNFLQLSIGGKL